MIYIAVGIFDEPQKISDAYEEIKLYNQTLDISLIGLDRNDEETEERLEGSEELELSVPYTSSLVSSLGDFQETLLELQYLDIGTLVLSGRLADEFSITKPILGEKKGNLAESFKEVGFDESLSSRFSDLIKNGSIILFVSAHEKEISSINNKLIEYGSIDNFNIKKNIFDI